jgi:hypothetical protein
MSAEHRRVAADHLSPEGLLSWPVHDGVLSFSILFSESAMALHGSGVRVKRQMRRGG